MSHLREYRDIMDAYRREDITRPQAINNLAILFGNVSREVNRLTGIRDRVLRDIEDLALQESNIARKAQD